MKQKGKFGLKVWNSYLKRTKNKFQKLCRIHSQIKTFWSTSIIRTSAKIQAKIFISIKGCSIPAQIDPFLINRESAKRKNKILPRERSKDSKSSLLFEYMFIVDSLYVYFENNQLLKIFQKDC